MYLHKTTGTTAGKVVPEPSMRNAASKSPPSTQTAKPSAPVPRSTAALIAAAGLSSDKLSASIVSFARFFSLPLKPELMAAIRRQALAPRSAQAPSASATSTEMVKHAAMETASDTGTTAKNREALSLAAAAAESKGVELHPKALEGFAEVVDPDWQKRQDSDGRNQRGRQDKRRGEQKEDTPAKTGPITGAGLREKALESMGENPLLAVLNRLPGKNGQRWIVLPFNLREGGREFKVSMRVLLETDNQASSCATCIVDIVEYRKTGSPEAERRWLFVLESTGRRSINRLTAYFQPELSPKAHSPLVRELSVLMGIKPERIFIKNRIESFPCESGSEDELWYSVNEAV